VRLHVRVLTWFCETMCVCVSLTILQAFFCMTRTGTVSQVNDKRLKRALYFFCDMM
jgi:hypothetical protein